MHWIYKYIRVHTSDCVLVLCNENVIGVWENEGKMCLFLCFMCMYMQVYCLCECFSMFIFTSFCICVSVYPNDSTIDSRKQEKSCWILLYHSFQIGYLFLLFCFCIKKKNNQWYKIEEICFKVKSIFYSHSPMSDFIKYVFFWDQ